MDVRDVSLIALWVLSLINLVLILRVVTEARRGINARSATAGTGHGELALKAPAPPFRARDLGGRRVTDEAFTGGVVLIFVSPDCGSCHTMLPMAHALAARAREADGTEFVLVSSAGPGRTKSWLTDLERDHDLRVTLSVLVAPTHATPFVTEYDPQGLFPYFVMVDGDDTVRARGIVGYEDWRTLANGWPGRESAEVPAATAGPTP
ncbi:redoxin domain-containing protein [Actinoallomurus sp. NBC_01490]|uniref:TlpA family protein disulfide reductase n=1 Tax=Actinoallomurus sp. NBC_01490 TaxID=2903557 RepID=UPI002E34094C|nr:redoxin domain-containing protein [Actinoallomurus sp. NBC_01490]